MRDRSGKERGKRTPEKEKKKKRPHQKTKNKTKNKTSSHGYKRNSARRRFDVSIFSRYFMSRQRKGAEQL